MWINYLIPKSSTRFTILNYINYYLNYQRFKLLSYKDVGIRKQLSSFLIQILHKH